MSGWTSGNANSGYSAKDMMRMQKEAEERVREMQERSRRALQETPSYPDFVKKPGPAHPPMEKAAPHTEQSTRPPSPQGQGQIPHAPDSAAKAQSLPHQPIAPEPPREGKLSGLLGSLSGSLGGLLGSGGTGPISRVIDALGIDNDKIIILILLLILINNNADKKLILALAYVLF